MIQRYILFLAICFVLITECAMASPLEAYARAARENIANLHEYGYKRLVALPSGAVRRDLSAGRRMIYSSSQYDVAIDGPGFFAVRDSAGRVCYTRYGRFEYASDTSEVRTERGVLQTREGWGIHMEKDATALQILPDGTVQVDDSKGNKVVLAHLAVFDFPAGALSSSDGRWFVATVGGQRVELGAPSGFNKPSGTRLVAGCLEDSNVDVLAEVEQLIRAQQRWGRPFDRSAATQARLRIIHKNLSNMDSVAYRKELWQAGSLVQVFTQGYISRADSPYDVAILGDGFFELVQDGKHYYTRNGAQRYDSERHEIVSAFGIRLVMRDPDGRYRVGFPLPKDAASLAINEKGECTVTRADGRQAAAGSMVLVRFAHPERLHVVKEGLYAASAQAGTPRRCRPNDPGDGTGMLEQGFLEHSNVNALEELLDYVLLRRP